jgi:hypothetical protein
MDLQKNHINGATRSAAQLTKTLRDIEENVEEYFYTDQNELAAILVHLSRQVEATARAISNAFLKRQNVKEENNGS